MSASRRRTSAGARRRQASRPKGGKRRSSRQDKARGAAPRRSAVARTSPGGLFIEWLTFFGVEPGHDYWKEPYWPPDIYVISAAFLRRTGMYVEFLNHADSHSGGRPRGDPEAERLGNDWRTTLSDGLGKFLKQQPVDLGLPEVIKKWWESFLGLGHERMTFEDAGKDMDVLEAAWNLCIASDVASRGLGVRTSYLKEERKDGLDPFLVVAEIILRNNDDLSFCLAIPRDKIAVLGKQHTPQVGCTIRSLTHHLSYYIPSEIKAYWRGPWARKKDIEVLNLLLLPWPTEVRSEDFRMAGASASGPHGYFEYSPTSDGGADGLRARVTRAIRLADAHAERIHGIVFPELALTQAQYASIEQLAVDHRAFLIAGVRDRENGWAENSCVIQPYGLTRDAESGRPSQVELDALRLTQLKHHRWRLDRKQILQYGLGGRLTASRECWERIRFEPRTIAFANLGAWLTVCALICEDLARQDPISDVVRAIGPNLVFALLMDGPQLKHRWPSRYASVLAEDPGCSVLTLTSLGMSARSKAEGSAEDKSTTIALWRDKWEGEREIALAPGHDACVLSLVSRSETEYTLDGRHDQGQAHFPIFAGSYSFSTASAKKPRA